MTDRLRWTELVPHLTARFDKQPFVGWKNGADGQLDTYWSSRDAAELLAVSVHRLRAWIARDRVPFDAADAVAVALDLMPWQIWPEWDAMMAAQIEAATLECAAGGCEERFTPKTRVQRFCSKTCKNREHRRLLSGYYSRPSQLGTCEAADCCNLFVAHSNGVQRFCSKRCASRVGMRRRYREDPLVAARHKAARLRYHEECRDYENRRQAAYYQANRERLLEKDKQRREQAA